MLKVLDDLGTKALAEKLAQADDALRELGATFPLPDDPAGKNRILSAHWMPRIVSRDHWDGLSAGLPQRGGAINGSTRRDVKLSVHFQDLYTSNEE